MGDAGWVGRRGAGVDGVLTDDERLVVAAAHHLGLLLASAWPDAAAHLLVQGAEGEAVAELAGLPRTASSCVVDQLVTRVLAELVVPEVSDDEAAGVIARLLGQLAAARPVTDEFAVIRALARLGPDFDYPSGVVGDAYYAAEWLDCECHRDSHERDAAVALEKRFRAPDSSAIDPELLSAISAHWI